MDSTSVSLLRRLRQPNEEAAWQRFVDLYAPLIFHWAVRAGVRPVDALDCVQEVLAVLVDRLPTFNYDPSKSFRAWLRTVTQNKCRDVLRRKTSVGQTVALKTEDAVAPNAIELFTDEEYRHAVVHRALEIMQTEFEPNTWKACWEHVTSGESAAKIAERLGLTENAVYLAKSRVLRRLREELDGLME